MTASPVASPNPRDAFWRPPPAEALAAQASGATGLSSDEAARRLAARGPNSAALPRRRRLPARVARRLSDPLVAILLVAGLIAGLTGDEASFAIILCVLSLSVALDVFQEDRAERAAEALRQSVATRATVMRDGREQEEPVESLVPGDVVALAAGDLVPADGIVLAADGAMANEALLTGEPYPVAKRPGPCPATDPAEAFAALFAGTALVGGRARMLVLATGAATRLGGISGALAEEPPPTAFARGVHRFGLLILRITAFLVLFVLLAHLLAHRPPLESFLFAVALAVGLTPELLPMVMTVTLARGALRMATRQVVVKRLAAIHDLGAMDVLCTDKTGTLTEARVALVAHPGPDGAPSAELLALARLNARLTSGTRSALDAALLQDAPDDGAPVRAIASLPFDFERRMVSVLVEMADGTRMLVVKGAAEAVLARCTACCGADRSVTLEDAARARLLQWQDAEAAEGLRVLAVAFRAMPPDAEAVAAEDEAGLTLAGHVVFADPPKQSAAAAIARLQALGVRTKILSGDAAPSVRHLVAVLGLRASGLMTGEEVASLSATALADRVGGVDLFARLSPDQKLRVIRALQARGHVVGFIGDGINDAPAIHAADAGLSVEGATDVARAAADMILLAPDLGVLADGVAEGRRTYVNIMKYVRMGTSSNFGNMLSMAVASLVIPFLPLTAVQVLLNNFLYDLSELGIPFDRVAPSDVAEPHGWDMAVVRRFTMTLGPISSAFDLLTFAVLLGGFGADVETFRTAWFVESMATQILVIFLIRTPLPFWRDWPHPVLAASSLAALSVSLFVALGPFGHVFGFVPLPAGLLVALGGIVLAYLAVVELAKPLAMGRHS